MRACLAMVCALLLAAQVAAPAFAQRSSQALGAELSGDQWAECFAVFTGMATILIVQGGSTPVQGAEGAGPANRFLALSEKAALRWLDSQGTGQDEAVLVSGLGQAVDQAIKTAATRSDLAAYLRRTSDRCIDAVNS